MVLAAKGERAAAAAYGAVERAPIAALLADESALAGLAHAAQRSRRQPAPAAANELAGEQFTCWMKPVILEGYITLPSIPLRLCWRKSGPQISVEASVHRSISSQMPKYGIGQ